MASRDNLSSLKRGLRALSLLNLREVLTATELAKELGLPRTTARRVLDTLIDAGVARSRSEALAWCVRLVARHQGEWIDSLREALVHVEKVRSEGPDA